ncbi:MAG: amidophosphoribosyltransferase [Bacteroidales bacterium]
MSGFFGAISKKQCVTEVFYGTDYHSHLGTKRGGLVFYNPRDGFQRSIHSIENSYFRTRFEADLKDFGGNAGLGIISDTDAQPILFNSHLGQFAIVTVSRIINRTDIEAEFLKKKKHFTENFEESINPTEIIANLICEENDFVSGIRNVFQKIKGSCSLLVLTTDRIIAARDKLGRTPVVIGKKEGSYAIASETTAFPNTGYETEYFIGPGEIMEVTADGYTTLKKAEEKMQVCAFLWVYFGYPTSYYEDINVEECRYRCGASLARRDNLNPDFISGIPDSGVAHAIGYGNEKDIPYKRAYTKYTPTWPRSFMPQEQETRELVAKMKLIPNKSIIKGKSIVFCDDSIVRGTQLKDTATDLLIAGARELHIRIACPPLCFACEFLNFSRSRSSYELATRKAVKQIEGEVKNMEKYSRPGSSHYRTMIEQITKNIGVDSLVYQDMNDLIKAIGLPAEKLCTHCWDNSSYF